MVKDGEKEKGKKVRKLTSFLCRELLYDYSTGQLDPQRHKAVAEFLKGDVDLQEELEALEDAIKYCEVLSETKISQPFMLELKENRSSLVNLAQKISWKNWPEFLQWSAEALLVSAMVAVLAIFVPWKKAFDIFPSKKSVKVAGQGTSVTKAETDKRSISDQQGAADVKKSAEGESGKDMVAQNSKQDSKTGLKTKVSEQAGPSAGDNAKAADDEEVAQEKSTDSKADSKTPESGEVNEKTKPALKGELYRAFMSHENINRVTADIKDKIVELGGEKAGKVELGWRKKDGSYFHLTIGESKYEELLTYLRNFGPVRIYKDPHWRVMPEGQIRIILWLEDAKK